jgi:hypothetical protein
MPSIDRMYLRPHSDGWMLQVDELDEPAWVVDTKRKAVEAAKDAARYHGSTLSVFTRAGDLQARHDYAS